MTAGGNRFSGTFYCLYTYSYNISHTFVKTLSKYTGNWSIRPKNIHFIHKFFFLNKVQKKYGMWFFFFDFHSERKTKVNVPVYNFADKRKT